MKEKLFQGSKLLALDGFQPHLTYLNKFKQVWTSSNKFHLVSRHQQHKSVNVLPEFSMNSVAKPQRWMKTRLERPRKFFSCVSSNLLMRRRDNVLQWVVARLSRKKHFFGLNKSKIPELYGAVCRGTHGFKHILRFGVFGAEHSATSGCHFIWQLMHRRTWCYADKRHHGVYKKACCLTPFKLVSISGPFEKLVTLCSMHWSFETPAAAAAAAL